MIPDLSHIKTMVANNNNVNFVRYFDGSLWYECKYFNRVDGNIAPISFEFPVPISDVGTATFLAQDKAMLFMRYIRKHINFLNEARENEPKKED